jgi:hypothetical protein
MMEGEEDEEEKNMNEKRWKGKLNHKLELVAEGTNWGGLFKA